MADPNDSVELDRSVARSEKFVADIKGALIEKLRDEGDAAESWMREIKNLELKRKSPKVIIGVVGATGSGKSSIINAVLGETQLVPTNCMRACTAVVTEISYNYGTTNYRAVIQFISREEWQNELEVLLGDIVISGNVTSNINDDDSEAGIAFAKVQAVYPHLNKSNLAQATITELLDCEYIKDLVSTEIEFSSSTARELYENIQKYVDSREKLLDDYTLHGLEASSAIDEIAYWPLIRAVKIYTKSAVLESGSVLVDLPGVADSNAARAAIAQKYLQSCAALWVVAPIIRAVDDKSARVLLGEGFKRQLWRDGTLQRLTFICSKTDEISIYEARSTLQRYSEMREKFAQIDQDRTNAMEKQEALLSSLLEAKRGIEQMTRSQKELIQEESEYKTLQGRAKDGQSVYPITSVEVSKRRASEEIDTTPTKKSRHEVHMAATYASPGKRPALDLRSTTSIQVQFREDTNKPRLTQATLKTKMESFKQKKREFKAKKKDLKAEEQSLRQSVAEMKARIAIIGAKEWITCVLGRNDVSSQAIRLDFAAGLKDLVNDENDGADEQYGADEADGEDDNDYEVESTVQGGPSALPVFCVSARGYHKLSGDMEDERISACFEDAADTGVPALREHVFKLGHEKMVASRQSYVDEAQRLLTSLRLWSSGEAASSTGEESATSKDEEFCLGLVNDFVLGVLQTANNVMDAITKIIDSEVLAVLPQASWLASNAAGATVMQWIASRKDDPPGLHWSTFRAVVRRSGVFAHPRKTYDFNSDLLRPYMRSIDHRWNEAFNVRTDKEFKKALRSSAAGLDKFVEPFADRLDPAQSGSESTVRQMFEDQVKLFTKSLGIVFRTARNSIETNQKEANRLFEESVKNHMKNIYQVLEDERGIGFYERAKAKIQAYVDKNKDVMFDKVSRRIKGKLQKMLEEVRDLLVADIQSTCDSLQRDCRYLCQKSRDFETLPKAAQKAIIRVIADADIDLATEDQTMIDVEYPCGKDEIADRPDYDGPHPMSMRSMTPVLMASDNKQDWSYSESESEDSDDSEDEEEEE